MVITMMGINDRENFFVLPYNPDTDSFKSLKVYKLLRLLKLYIFEKFEKTGNLRSEEKNENKVKIEKEYYKLDLFYGDHGEFDKAEAIRIDPNSEDGHIKLGVIYRNQGKYDKAEATLKEAIRINPRNDVAIGALAIFSKEQKKHTDAEKYFNKVDMIRLKYYSLMTYYNYNKLRKIVINKRIKLVCVQYPMRNVEPLKKMLESNRNIVFVDNEKVFKEAVNKNGYNEYFRDVFGGDFGHCTPKGNELLAKNIVDMILKGVHGL